MIADFIFMIICAVVIVLIVYGIYNRQTTTGIRQPSTINKYDSEDIKTAYVDRLNSSHLSSFYKLFSNK
ncbi:IMV membrane protein [Swinepox virus]|uniref:IMV membrane protein n=1 Tax=Swinepox virus TaxID=10276 RepID=A0A881SY67_SWPV|nr:IMV membrane protein [Swinepox virus]